MMIIIVTYLPPKLLILLVVYEYVFLYIKLYLASFIQISFTDNTITNRYNYCLFLKEIN